jgi:hypothetical protein
VSIASVFECYNLQNNQMHQLNFASLRLLTVGPDGSVGIATGYGLDGPGIESRWRRDFLHLCRPALGPNQPSVQWVPSFPGGK